MSIESAVNAYLRTISGIGDRVYPLVIPSKKIYPLLTYNLTNDSTKSRAMDDGGVKSGSPSFDIHVWSEGYLEGKGIARAIESGVNSLTNPQTWNGQDIHSARCTNVHDLPFDSESKLFHIVVDIIIHTQEA